MNGNGDGAYKGMVMVVKKKMVVVMAVMVVAVVGGHFDPKIRIWNSCLSSPPAPQPLPHPAPSDSLGPGGSSQDQPTIGTLAFFGQEVKNWPF